MSGKSKIEWTDATWNPVTGCDHVSPGCDNCYAERMATRFHQPFIGAVQCHPDRLEKPLHWKKPRKVFVNSVSDLFHPDVPDDFIVEVFAVMALTPRHTYQILTKRPQRMAKYMRAASLASRVGTAAWARNGTVEMAWPLPNVWLGVSIEEQKWADLRIPYLLETKAAVRFLSVEPLLGPVDLDPWFRLLDMHSHEHAWRDQRIDWVIVGGESGPAARPMHVQWARDLRDACVHWKVPFLFKQWGEYLCATVEDDEGMSGGRAFTHPLHGFRSSATLRETGPGKTRSGITRLMEPGDQTIGGIVMLDSDTVAVRIGKGKAGRELDGRLWDEYPA